MSTGDDVRRLLMDLRYGRREAESQVLSLLRQTPSLRPMADTYVFNNGTSQRLLKLSGTVPITYQYNKYNIPVAFYLPLDFPGVAPMCYVTPTPTMKVKERHLHVGPTGFIYHPYLHGWNPRMSTLCELVGLLCSVFGSDPPVYAVSAGSSSSARSSVRPGGGGGGGYPGSGYPGAAAASGGGGSGLSYAYGSKPMGAPGSSGPYGGGPAASSMSAYGAGPGAGPGAAGPGAAYSSGSSGYGASGYGGPGAAYGGGPGAGGPPSYGSAVSGMGGMSGMSGVSGVGASSAVSASSSSETDMALVKSNFEVQLKRHLEELYAKENAEMNKLASKRKSLETNSEKLKQIKEKLDGEKSALESRREELKTGIAGLETWLAANDDSIGEDGLPKKFDINELVKFSDPWSEQCMDACSSDYAYTDVLLELDRLLEDETITLAEHMKQMRKLAREQFMKRALAQAVFLKQDELVKRSRAH